MLSPTERTVLTETLRPPVGYEIDRVIASTYTLDLITLLTLPLSFTLLSWDRASSEGRVDPIALLEALRRHARRITVFCDAGHIAVPRRGEILFGYLEKSVVEVTAPKDGAFHPKVTIVRYTPDEGDPAWQDAEWPGHEAVRYRLLCGTRNLTFDRSWDTLLVLDGDLVTSRRKAFARNRPLSRFVSALPGFAVHKLEPKRRKSVEQVADELLRVKFEPPEGFGRERNDLVFWPIGLDAREEWPFGDRTDRLLVISPFIDKTCMGWLKDDSDIAVVVSRPEELDKLPTDALDGVHELYTLADAAESSSMQETVSASDALKSDDASREMILAEASDIQLCGLHAKLFVADAGWNATIWTGSANATSAAFKRNVEFLVQLRGKKSSVGIDALLGNSSEREASAQKVELRDMLERYSRPNEPLEPDQIQRRLEWLCGNSRRILIEARLMAHITVGSGKDTATFDVVVRPYIDDVTSIPDGVECGIRPISRSQNAAQAIKSLRGDVAQFKSLAVESLSSFFAVTVTARAEGRSHSQRFTLNLPLLGAPDDRENRLLLAMLSNRERLIRYLLMLLQGTEIGLQNLTGQGNGASWKGGAFSGPFDLPLLEPLLRILAEDAARLADVERLIRDLEATEDGACLLPEDFMVVWQAVRAAMPSAKKKHRGDS